MSDFLELNKLEQLAQQLGQELVIVDRDGYWVITENIGDRFAYGLPIVIGNSEAEAKAWLTKFLSEVDGE